MPTSPFINRRDELDLLQSRFESETAELLVIYGRRRLGKSALVREAIRDRDDAVYWQATEETPAAQLTNFVDTASDTFPLLEDIQRDWEALLRALGREDAIVVLDEFPYLIESDDALPSKVQRVWDLHLQETEMTLVLVGSSISIMEEKVLGGGSPLYGRRTATIDLPPLSLDDARELYPAAEADETIQSWGVFRGDSLLPPSTVSRVDACCKYSVTHPLRTRYSSQRTGVPPPYRVRDSGATDLLYDLTGYRDRKTCCQRDC